MGICLGRDTGPVGSMVAEFSADWGVFADQGNRGQLYTDRRFIPHCRLGLGTRAKQPSALCISRLTTPKIIAKLMFWQQLSAMLEQDGFQVQSRKIKRAEISEI